MEKIVNKNDKREVKGGKKIEMEKAVKITLIIVVAVIVLALIGTFLFLSRQPGNTVDVQGQSTIKANPDIITVYFSVETNGSTAKEAKDKNSEIVDKAIANLTKIGITSDRIQTENFNIYPEYNWSDNTIMDYKATHSIKVELNTTETDKIGKTIDAGVDAGALINYINFELSTAKQNEYKAQALKQATEDAKTKAEAMASGLGKKLGKVVSISDMSFDYNPWPIYANAGGIVGAREAKQATTNIQPSQQEVNARVSVVYEIV